MSPICLPTANLEWVFWGTSGRNGRDQLLTWTVASRVFGKELKITPTRVGDLLDAKFGRHLADDLSFIKGGPTTTTVVASHLKARLADPRWKSWFDEAAYDVKAIAPATA